MHVKANRLEIIGNLTLKNFVYIDKQQNYLLYLQGVAETSSSIFSQMSIFGKSLVWKAWNNTGVSPMMIENANPMRI